MEEELTVDFVGDVRRLAPGEELTFGRKGDLEIDENRHLHRLLGRFRHHNGSWWLRNEGRTIPILLADRDSRSRATVSPGTEMPIGFARSFVRFRAGQIEYELEVTCPVPAAADDDRDDDYDHTFDTISIRSVPLTDDQRLVLVALAEQALRDPHAPVTLPSNSDMARRIGWTLRRFNRKVDNLCDKFTKAGVKGLHGSVDQLATDRRRILVEHCVESAVVTPLDLAVLDEPEPPD